MYGRLCASLSSAVFVVVIFVPCTWLFVCMIVIPTRLLFGEFYVSRSNVCFSRAVIYGMGMDWCSYDLVVVMMMMKVMVMK